MHMRRMESTQIARVPAHSSFLFVLVPCSTGNSLHCNSTEVCTAVPIGHNSSPAVLLLPLSMDLQ